MEHQTARMSRASGRQELAKDDFQTKLDEADRQLKRLHTIAIQEAHAKHKKVRESALKALELYDLEQQSILLAEEEEQNRRIQAAQQRLVEQETRYREAMATRQRQNIAMEEERRKSMLSIENLAVKSIATSERHSPSEEKSFPTADVRTTIQEPSLRPSPVSTKPALNHVDETASTPRTAGISGPQQNQLTNGEKGLAELTSASPNDAAVDQHSTLSKQTIESETANKIHEEYLKLHQQLKEFRNYMATLGKQDLQFKNMMGDQRRELNKIVGQMTYGDNEEVRTANKDRIRRVYTVLQNAQAVKSHMVDIRNFFAPHREAVCGDSEAQVSALYIYLLNQLSKIVIRQFIREAGISPEKAEAVGLLVVTAFTQKISSLAANHYTIDILLAKYHVLIPALFGVNKFPRDQDATFQEDLEKIIGLSAGYAAITLRDFSKATIKNPLPPSMLWRTLSSIVNTAPDKRHEGHYHVLKAFMHPAYATKLMRFYGDLGLAIVKNIVIHFPEGRDTSGAKALRASSLIFQRDLGLYLEP